MSRSHFEVEAIRSKRRAEHGVEYLVKWKNFDDKNSTWEAEKKLKADGCGEMLRTFNSKRKRFEPEAAAVDGGGFVVELIRDKRQINGKTQYLVKWRGFADFANTWEPEEQLLEDTVDIEQMIQRGKLAKLEGTAEKKVVDQSIMEDLKSAPPARIALPPLPPLKGDTDALDGNICSLATQMLTQLMENDEMGPFMEPVDAEALGLVDYHLVVKRPMDLTTAQTMLTKRQFVDLKQLNETIQRVWGNCMAYNYEKSDIWAQAATAAKIHVQVAKEIFGIDDTVPEPPPPKPAAKAAAKPEAEPAAVELVADEEAPPPECEPIPELAAPAPVEQLVQMAAEHVGNPFVPQSKQETEFVAAPIHYAKQYPTPAPASGSKGKSVKPWCPNTDCMASDCKTLGGGTHGKYRYQCRICHTIFQQERHTNSANQVQGNSWLYSAQAAATAQAPAASLWSQILSQPNQTANWQLPNPVANMVPARTTNRVHPAQCMHGATRAVAPRTVSEILKAKKMMPKNPAMQFDHVWGCSRPREACIRDFDNSSTQRSFLS